MDIIRYGACASITCTYYKQRITCVTEEPLPSGGTVTGVPSLTVDTPTSILTWVVQHTLISICKCHNLSYRLYFVHSSLITNLFFILLSYFLYLCHSVLHPHFLINCVFLLLVLLLFVVFIRDLVKSFNKLK